MATLIPYINPLRLKRRYSDINYQTKLPRFDLMTQRTDYQKGINAQKGYYPDFLKGEKLIFEIFTTTPIVGIEGILYQPDGSTRNMTVTDITPTGWVSESIFTVSIFPNIVGINSVSIKTDNGYYDSDEFNLSDSGDNSDKNLIAFKYSDSQNRLEYGGGYFTGDGGNWNPIAYFTGIIKKIPSSREETIYIDEPGNPITLQVTASKSQKIILTDINEQYIDVIEEIIKVDTLYINQRLMTISDFSYEEKNVNSDIGDITMTATYADNNGYYDY